MDTATLPEVAESNATTPLTRLLRNGDTYQNGVRPGPRKLAQFREVLALRKTPALYSQDGRGKEAVATIKIFDPCGGQTFWVTEWDGGDLVFGLGRIHCDELGYASLSELANVRGKLGIGLEIDMHFLPSPLSVAAQEG